jgi:hypothetical protein
MTSKRRLILIASALLCILFYSFYLKERLQFNESKSATTLAGMQTYFRKYPQGRYVKDLEILEEEMAYKLVKKDPSMINISQYYKYCGEGRRTDYVMFQEVKQASNIDVVRSFIQSYPNSKYISDAKKKLSTMWTAEFDIYEEAVKKAGNSADAKSVAFFRELLKYMKSKDLSQIYIKFNRTTRLKDYTEYSSEARNYLDLMYTDHPVKSNITSLKGNFSEGNLESLEEDVVKEMKSVFFGIFTNDFFGIDKATNNSKIGPNDLVLQISYEIESQEEVVLGTKVPDLWIHTQTSEYGVSSFQGYIIGIDAKFNFDFKIPNSSQSYAFKYIGDPGSNISGFEGMNEGYRIMVRNTFSDFVRNISDNFGLSR